MFSPKLTSVLLCCALRFLAVETTAAQEHEAATLTVTSDALHYFLYLDGVYIGETPVRDLPLEVGSHSLRAYRRAVPTWGEIPWFREFSVDSAQNIAFYIPNYFSLIIKSKPYDAQVHMNGQFIGTTPLRVVARADTVETLKVSKEGYEEFSTSLSSLELPVFEVVLSPFSEMNGITSDIASQFERSRRTKRAISWGFLGATVLSGVTALYLKNEANDTYEEYLNAGNPERMDYYYGRSEEYDRYASAAFGVFQLNFLLWAYFFVKSAK